MGIVEEIFRTIVFSSSTPWVVLHALWSICIVVTSTKFIYNSNVRKFIITAVMAIFQGEIFAVGQRGRGEAITNILLCFSIEILILIFSWFIISKIPERVTRTTFKYISPIIGFLTSFLKARLFVLSLYRYYRIDPRICLIIIICFTLSQELVDFGFRYFFHNRTVTSFTSNLNLIIMAVIVAIGYQLSNPRSTIGKLFPSIELTHITIFIAFAIALVYIKILLWK